MSRSIYAYAWDLAEEGVGDAVARFRDAGLDSVALAGAYHAGKFMRPHGRGKVYFPEDGTIYYNADPGDFGRIKPLANALLAERDVLRELTDIDGLTVRAWMVLLHNTRVGTAHPDVTVQNAFGDRYVYSLCPSAPDARDFAVALCRTVTAAYPIEGLRLETPGFLPFAHGFHHEFGLMRQNAWLDNHLGLCFCDHCRAGAKAAGIDADALARHIAARIETYLASEVDYPDDMAAAFWLADIVTNADLAAFLRFRCETVTALVAEIRDAVRADAHISIVPSVARPTSGAWYEGSDLAALAGAADGITACFYEQGPDRVAADLHDVRGRLPDGASLGGILRPGHPDLDSRDKVKASVAILAAAGLDDIGFYNYGHVRAPALDWIGDAFRSL